MSRRWKMTCGATSSCWTFVSHTPVETKLLGEAQAAFDWTDATRHFIPPDEKIYSWWSYRAGDWEASDRGRRLDHVWASPGLKGALKSHKILKKMRGWQKASDHVPVVVDLGGVPGLKMRLALLRHGPTEWNALGKIQGQVDIRAQRRRASQNGGAALALFPAPRLYASPLLRARQTAEALGLENPILDARLMEQNWGVWEGLTREEILARHGDERFCRKPARNEAKPSVPAAANPPANCMPGWRRF